MSADKSFHILFSFPLDAYLEMVGVYMVVLFPYCFLWCLHQFTYPPAVHRLPFSPQLHQYFIIYLFDDSHFDLCQLLFFFFCFLGPHPWHMQVPRLRVESELQLPAYTLAMPNPSCVFDLHHSSQQCQILTH